MRSYHFYWRVWPPLPKVDYASLTCTKVVIYSQTRIWKSRYCGNARNHKTASIPSHGRRCLRVSASLIPIVDNSVSAWTIRCQGQFGVRGQFGVSSSLLLPLHQVGKLDSWEDFQDRQAMTLFTTRSTAGTTEPMSSAPTANGICSLAISPAPRHGILSHSSATA